MPSARSRPKQTESKYGEALAQNDGLTKHSGLVENLRNEEEEKKKYVKTSVSSFSLILCFRMPW